MIKAKPGRDILRRFENNPLITLENVPFRCAAIWNAAVTVFQKSYLMLITIEELEGTYRVYRADSIDGLEFKFSNQPPVFSECDSRADAVYEIWGVRDPRITRIANRYYISYVAESGHGHRVGLVSTRDFFDYECFPYASQVDVKNGPLFPDKINGSYCLLKRPHPGHSLWLSFSDDLSFWGGDRCVMTPRGGYWDASRIGPAGPPVATEDGWLLIYYGVKSTSGGPLVRLGAAILDRNEPWRVIGRSNIPILAPREPYERFGDVPNVVFSCGSITQDDLLHVYYGASDSCICRASAPVSEVVDVCLNGRSERF